jgi:hypothetical protein
MSFEIQKRAVQFISINQRMKTHHFSLPFEREETKDYASLYRNFKEEASAAS